ncbi:MAG: phosphoglycerate mutase family protein [Blastocatellia bacterium]|nr:phosphoglycerate mutase family protein [Blastocatellia bacterium]
MNTTSVSRFRPFARIVSAVLLLVVGVGASTGRTSPGDDGFKATTVYLVRHAEKAATPPADPPLLDAGNARAQALARTLARAGIKTVFTSQYLRTRQTAEPLARQLGLTPSVVPVRMDTMSSRELDPKYLEEMVRRVHAAAGENILIVGHSNTVPALIKALGGDVVPTISESEYDDLFIVTVVAKGKARVAHLKQQL